MGNDFASARLESIRRNKYLLKHLKNKTARTFVSVYNDSSKQITDEVKKIVCLYNRLDRGSLNIQIFDSDIENISKDEIEQTYMRIKEKSNTNFTYFYESYLRKIEKGYEQQYIQNALSDLKNAYYTYRKLNNPSWNLENYQISENEIRNLYNILNDNKIKKACEEKSLEEK